MIFPVVYDSARQRTVLFEGLGSNSGLSDTWEWDGKNWKKVDQIDYRHDLVGDALLLTCRGEN